MLENDITPSYILQYIRGITPAADDLSAAVEERCRREEVPILDEEVKSLLRFLLLLKPPRRILEVGTAYGFSSIFMSQFVAPEGHIDTIERNPAMWRKAKPNIQSAGLENTITLHIGHAQEILPTLTGPYEVILLDASMGQYGLFWEEIKRLLCPGGWLLADNVLHSGMTAKPRLEIPRRQRTIHSRLQAFLRTVLVDEEFASSLLPIGDGVLLSLRQMRGSEE